MNSPLFLSHLPSGVPALTPTLLATLTEAASVALSKHKHSNPIALWTLNNPENRYELHFLSVTDQMRRSHADPDECTEWGACAIAIAILLEETDYTVVHRSWIGTGYDYSLGKQGDLIFSKMARLEVSGLHSGGESEVKARTRKKIKQTSVSDREGLPVVIVVVEFSVPMVEVTHRNAA